MKLSMVSDDELLQGLTAAGMSSELINLIVEMGPGVRASIITQDFFESGQKASGLMKIEQFAVEFRDIYGH